ncbi:MAG: flagellar filament capping protein FliD [Nitrospirae bacterium]|nr:flagellar filament capping protein FliD [Nitrospirota bacterium]
MQIAPTLTLQPPPDQSEKERKVRRPPDQASPPSEHEIRENDSADSDFATIDMMFFNADGVPVVVPFQFHPLAVTAEELKNVSLNNARARLSDSKITQDIRFAYSMVDGKLAISGATTAASFAPQGGATVDSSPGDAVVRQTISFIDLKSLNDIATTSFLFIRRRVPPMILNDSIPSALRARDALDEIARYQSSNSIQSNLDSNSRMVGLRMAAFETVKSQLADLRSQVRPLLRAASFVVNGVGSSDDSIVRGAADNSAAEGILNVAVKQVARPHIIESDAVSNANTVLTSLGGGNLYGSFKINGYTILVDTRDNPEDRDTVGAPGSPYGVSPNDFTTSERKAIAARMRTLQGIADQINYGLEDLNKNGIIDGPIQMSQLGPNLYGFIRVSEDRIVDPNEFRTNYIADDDKLESSRNLDGIVTTRAERIGVKASIRNGRLRLESLDPARRITLENTSSLGEGNIIHQLGLTYKDAHQIIESDETALTYNNFSFKNSVQDEQRSIVVSAGTRRSEYSTTITDFQTGLDLLLEGTSHSVKIPVTRTGSLNQGTYIRGANSYTRYSSDTVNEPIDDVVRNLIRYGVILPTESDRLSYDNETLTTRFTAKNLLESVRTFISTYNDTMRTINDLLAGNRALLDDPTLESVRTDLVRGAEFPVGVLDKNQDELKEIGLENSKPEKMTFLETSVFSLLQRLRLGPAAGSNVPKGERSIFAKLDSVGITSLTDDSLKLDEQRFLFEASYRPDRIQDLFIPENAPGVADRLDEILRRFTKDGTGAIDLHLTQFQRILDRPEDARRLPQEAGRIQSLRLKGGILKDLLV